MTQEESKDLCKTCKHYWTNSPIPFDSAFHCDIVDNKFHRSKIMDDIVPYPCTKCSFDCYIKKIKTMTCKLTFGDIKKMDYADEISFKLVLVDLLYKKFINMNDVLTAYDNAIEKERNLGTMRFNEACTNLTQLVCGNFNGKDKQEAVKRSLHTLNICKIFPPHIYDKMYDYTDEDEKRLDEFCKTIYGTDLKS